MAHPERASARPNFLVIMADEHSPHTLGCYGNPIVSTPALDGLAARGVLFEDAYCNAPLCVPSRASLMSGRYPWRIGAWNNESPTPTHLTSLPGRLRTHGYRTVGLGKMHLIGPDQLWGFDSRPYGDFGGISHQPDPIRTAPRMTFLPDAGPAEIPDELTQEHIVTRLGIDFLRAHDGRQPFCLWLSYNRPHFPVTPPQRYFDRYFPQYADLPDMPPGHIEQLHPWMHHHRRFFRTEHVAEEQVRRARAAYYGCVSFVDAMIGRVLSAADELGLLDSTVVIYTSDHGEMLGEHGLWRKCCFYDAAVRVPLIVSWPGHLLSGARVTEPVQLVDLYPTLLELAGAPAASGGDGSSLVGPLSGRYTPRNGYAISEYSSHGVPGPMRMIKHGDWKLNYYLDANPSLFNLREDPGEFEDRVDDPGAQRVRRDLEALVCQGWDAEAVRAQFRYAPSMDKAHSYYLDMAPNQYCLPDGTLIDAEDFYPGVDWADASGKASH